MLQYFEIDPKWRGLGDCLLSNSTVQVLPYRINCTSGRQEENHLLGVKEKIIITYDAGVVVEVIGSYSIYLWSA